VEHQHGSPDSEFLCDGLARRLSLA
jgi:hypothetical protein